MDDSTYMQLALDEAQKAYERGEVPVGAVVVLGDTLVGRGFNLKECTQNPLAHAELVAIEEASRALGCWRLTDATLYVTLEPCIMCAGAIVQARLKRLVFGCRDPKAGAVVSLYRILEDSRLNHRVEVGPQVLEQACSEILSRFFHGLRERQRG